MREWYKFNCLIVAIAFFQGAGFSAKSETKDASDWQPMQYSDLVDKTNNELLKIIWKSDVDERVSSFSANNVKRKPTFPVLSAIERLGNKTVIVSVSLFGECDYGANDSGAEIEPAMCKGNISVFDGNNKISSNGVDICFAGHSQDSVPKKNTNDNTFARFQDGGRSVSVRSNVGGRFIKDCSHTYKINIGL